MREGFPHMELRISGGLNSRGASCHFPSAEAERDSLPSQLQFSLVDDRLTSNNVCRGICARSPCSVQLLEKRTLIRFRPFPGYTPHCFEQAPTTLRRALILSSAAFGARNRSCRVHPKTCRMRTMQKIRPPPLSVIIRPLPPFY